MVFRKQILWVTACLVLPALSVFAGESSPLDGEMYSVDTRHSLLDFTVRHEGYSRVRGSFDEYRGAIYFVADDLSASAVALVIEVASIDTGHPGRDGILVREFFAAEQHPVITFHSERVEAVEGGVRVTGPLTMRGVTREVTIPLSMMRGEATDQFRHTRIAFTGELSLDRKDFGISYSNEFWDSVAAVDVKIELDISAVVYNSKDTIFRWRELSIGTIVLATLEESGLEAAQAKVRELWPQREEYDFRLSQLSRAGLQLLQEGRYDEALGIFDVALQVFAEEASKSELADLHVLSSEAWGRKGDLAKARAALAAALALDPHHPQGHVWGQQLGALGA